MLRTLHDLPNVLCRQQTDRYRIFRQREGASPQSHMDTITATARRTGEGARTYVDVKINGKPAGADLLSGMWSTNDFSSSLELLFDPAHQPDFEFEQEDRIGDTRLLRFGFALPAERAESWPVIQVGTLAVRSGYRGKIWIDPHNYTVVRIRSEATGLPPEFPYESLITTTDYAQFALAGRVYQLPTRTEVVACARRRSDCFLNVSQFGEYALFASEHRILPTP